MLTSPRRRESNFLLVAPAKAGAQGSFLRPGERHWMPAFAGMTKETPRGPGRHRRRESNFLLVAPAKAGAQRSFLRPGERHWMPAFAGMTLSPSSRRRRDVGANPVRDPRGRREVAFEDASG